MLSQGSLALLEKPRASVPFRQEVPAAISGPSAGCRALSWLWILPQICSAYWTQNSYSRPTLCGPWMSTESSDFLGLGKMS